MTVKKVIAFALVLTLALGGLVFAHAAVTDSQDELLVYPTLQLGDPAALEGRTVSLTISCGDHLRWLTDYPFGGEAVTEFAYSRTPIQPPTDFSARSLDVWFSGGMSSSVSSGEFSPKATDYGSLLQAVAQETPSGGSKTMSLTMSDYVDYYLPDYQLSYKDEQKQCSEAASLSSFLSGDYRHEDMGSYRALLKAFRFPVQPGHIISVTVDKDDAGRVVGIQLYPENGPELHFLSDVNAEGVWFVPVYRDESGTPLPYESPQGHGIYFIPWRTTGAIHYTATTRDQVTPDVKNARLVFPLEEALQIEHITIDADTGSARMLTLENGMYILTTCDLETGTVRSRLELLPHDPENPDATASFRQEGAYLLVLLQSSLALTDAAGETLLLTAPDALGQTFGARFFDPDTGDLRFDGETLILTDTTWHKEGAFWAAAWRQGELRVYGEYDCSLLRGNDSWYYSYVTAEEYPIILK